MIHWNEGQYALVTYRRLECGDYMRTLLHSENGSALVQFGEPRGDDEIVWGWTLPVSAIGATELAQDLAVLALLLARQSASSAAAQGAALEDAKRRLAEEKAFVAQLAAPHAVDLEEEKHL